MKAEQRPGNRATLAQLSAAPLNNLQERSGITYASLVPRPHTPTKEWGVWPGDEATHMQAGSSSWMRCDFDANMTSSQFYSCPRTQPGQFSLTDNCEITSRLGKQTGMCFSSGEHGGHYLE